MDLPPRSILVPVVAGVVSLLVACCLAWLTFFQPEDDPAPTPPAVETGTVVNATGGYSVQVPVGMRARRSGKVTRITDRQHALSVTISPTTNAKPANTNKAVLQAMGKTYRSVILTTSERLRVDRHQAVASYGRATTTKGTKLRFVLIAVHEGRRSFAISAFADASAAPATVLPRVRAITNGFRAKS